MPLRPSEQHQKTNRPRPLNENELEKRLEEHNIEIVHQSKHTPYTSIASTLEIQELKKEVQQTLDRISETKNVFQFPKELAKYLDFRNGEGKTNVVLADILNVIHGKLDGKDKQPWEAGDSYKPIDDGAGVIMLDTILGTNSFWQLIINHCNHWINDTYPEMRWEYDSKAKAIRPKLVIYNRVKPFTVSDSKDIVAAAAAENKNPYEPKQIQDFISYFKNIRIHQIPREDLILVNVGNNWRDRYNFIEVNVHSQILGGMPNNQTYDAETKIKNQTFDEVAIGRDGFKPMLVNAKYIPKDTKGKKLDPFRLLEYKTMNREWFFNIHRMLNGTMTLIGQSQYVAVGDNLLIDADAIFAGKNTNLDHIKNSGKAYFLAHIESVSHNVSVNAVGARSFTTEIQFVRGIIVDANGNRLDDDQLLDEDTSQVTPVQELNSNRVFGTSSGKAGAADPDIQKLKGR